MTRKTEVTVTAAENRHVRLPTRERFHYRHPEGSGEAGELRDMNTIYPGEVRTIAYDRWARRRIFKGDLIEVNPKKPKPKPNSTRPKTKPKAATPTPEGDSA